jgi:protein gp37
MNCYAEKIAFRFNGEGMPYAGLIGEHRQWNGKIMLIDSVLLEPLSWKKPSKIFVNSMSDLFYEAVPLDFIDKVFAVMALASQHTFQVLTKRPGVMKAYMQGIAREPERLVLAAERMGLVLAKPAIPLPNVWLGVSVENQEWANKRIGLLLTTIAAVRWISLEPMIGRVNLTMLERKWGGRTHIDNALDGFRSAKNGGSHGNKLDWVVLGGESGDKARIMKAEWVRKVRDDCAQHGVPFLFKQWGEYLPSNHPDCPPGPPLKDWVWEDGKPFEKGDHREIQLYRKVGTKHAGRTLDGVLHDGYPVAR